MKKFQKFFNRYKILLSALLIAAICVGGTLAYLKASDGAVTNTFALANVHVKVIEGDDGTEDSKVVTVKNTGDSPAFVRARVVISRGTADLVTVSSPSEVPAYADRAANTLYVVLNTGTAANVWTKDGTAEDSYFYYNAILPTNTATSALVNGVFAGPGIDASSFNVVVYAESVLGSGTYSLDAAKAAFTKVS